MENIFGFIAFVLIALAVGVIQIMLHIRANTIRLNGLRRDDGSYADYDFPGIFNGGNPQDLISPNRNKPGPHEKSSSSSGPVEYDLYGRPLPPDVIEQRRSEAEAPKQIVYVLRHTMHEDAEPKLLGIYESHDSAKVAIERFQQLDEFAEYSDGFRLAEYELGKDYGDTGFNSN